VETDPIIRNIYLALTALCGSITALAYMRYKEMGWGEISLNLFIGLAFAFFVAPWAGHTILRINETDARALCMVTYVFAAGWPLILPRIINWGKGLVPEKDQENKP
jgi:hypothetical protein